jgi:hypothetical protein
MVYIEGEQDADGEEKVNNPHPLWLPASVMAHYNHKNIC